MLKDDKPNAARIGWTLRRTSYLFRSHWLNIRQDVVELSQQEEFTYTYVEHPGAVLVVPQTHQGEFILIHSYRYPIDDWCWEVPSGTLGDKSSDIHVREVARDELLEEIGGQAAEMVDLGEYFMANGFARYSARVFLAQGVEIVKPSSPEITEKIECIRPFKINEVLDMISKGTINDGESAFAILRAVAYLDAATRAAH